ncbi:F-box protein CPR30-like [Herrania umbratica]|uniref:F-box protein CPR30-like n=1 Tax=Herrania umbratica TaxID=108875 RepID=A0A6J1AXU3_9ROSI|nr:F-box protein CPR30-like [Herrania umbratica]XP_021291230.1 F-box protein CPR30-like [Herrania umbratica]
METISQLPHDIIANILSRLPVKCLLRSKCVCKPWRSLISDPQFAKLHLAESQKDSNIDPHRILLSTNPLLSINLEAYHGTEDGSNAIILELDYPEAITKDVEYEIDFAGSCNGLVCLVVDYKNFILWNPSTRESRPLPEPKHHLRDGSLSYGLGFDFSTDDYKLLSVARRHWSPASVSDKTTVEVFSMRTNVWRRIPDLKIDVELDGSGIFLKGSLHWLSSLTKIISFDLAEEKFQEVVPLPARMHENHYVATMGLGVWGDCLCLFIECGETLYEGWLMREHGVKSSWTRLFSAAVDPLPGFKYWQIGLCYTKTGKLVIDYDGWRLVLYDPQEQRLEDLAIRNNWDWFHSIIYFESLVSPNLDDVSNRENHVQD